MREHLTLWTNPWRPAQDWFDLSPVFNAWDSDETSRTYLPACEVEELQDKFLITLDVPGVTKEDIKLEVADGRLVVSAERKQEKTENKESRFFSERRYGKFQRVFELSDAVDPEKIEAAYQDGVLKIAVAKAEKIQPRKIEIKSESKGGLFDRLVSAPKSQKVV